MSDVTLATMRARCHAVLDMLEWELPESVRLMLLAVEKKAEYHFGISCDGKRDSYHIIARRIHAMLPEIRAAIERWDDIARLFYAAFERVAAGTDFWTTFLDAFEEAVRRDTGLTIPYDMGGRLLVHRDRGPDKPYPLTPQRDGHYAALIADILEEREVLTGVPYCMHDIIRERPMLDRMRKEALVITAVDPVRRHLMQFFECMRQEVRRAAAREWERHTAPLWRAAEEKARIAAEKRSRRKRNAKQLRFNPAWLLYGVKLVMNLVGMVLLRIDHEHLDWSLPDDVGGVFAAFQSREPFTEVYQTASPEAKALVGCMDDRLLALNRLWDVVSVQAETAREMHSALREAAQQGDVWGEVCRFAKAARLPDETLQRVLTLPGYGLRPEALQAAGFIFRDGDESGDMADGEGLPVPEELVDGPVPAASLGEDSPENPDVPLHGGRI